MKSADGNACIEKYTTYVFEQARALLRQERHGWRTMNEVECGGVREGNHALGPPGK